MFGFSPSQPEREGWQDGDIGEGSMDNYMPKQKEFITFVVADDVAAGNFQ